MRALENQTQVLLSSGNDDVFLMLKQKTLVSETIFIVFFSPLVTFIGAVSGYLPAHMH